VLNVVEELRRRLTETREDLAEYLVNGNVDNHGEYMRIVGKAQGLQTALNELKELESKYIED
jgi:hypothetical protein